MNNDQIIEQVHVFVLDFMKKHNTLISAIGRKYLIPNRYNIEDIKQYIAERIIKILSNRLTHNKNNIENPEKYFKSCLDYYCIEYQRMHGYIFDLPKRPRKNCQEDEEEIKSKGFKYLDDVTIEESNELQRSYEHEYAGEEISHTSEIWCYLTGLLTSEEGQVLECIYVKNMTWNETSIYLGVPQSTCWFRKNRAVQKLYDGCLSLSGVNIAENLKSIIRGNAEKLEELKYNVE